MVSNDIAIAIFLNSNYKVYFMQQNQPLCKIFVAFIKEPQFIQNRFKLSFLI